MLYAFGPASVSRICEFRLPNFGFLPSASAFSNLPSRLVGITLPEIPRTSIRPAAPIRTKHVSGASVVFGAREVEDHLGLLVRGFFFGGDVGVEELVANVLLQSPTGRQFEQEWRKRKKTQG